MQISSLGAGSGAKQSPIHAASRPFSLCGEDIGGVEEVERTRGRGGERESAAPVTAEESKGTFFRIGRGRGADAATLLEFSACEGLGAETAGVRAAFHARTHPSVLHPHPRSGVLQRPGVVCVDATLGWGVLGEDGCFSLARWLVSQPASGNTAAFSSTVGTHDPGVLHLLLNKEMWRGGGCRRPWEEFQRLPQRLSFRGAIGFCLLVAWSLLILKIGRNPIECVWESIFECGVCLCLQVANRRRPHSDIDNNLHFFFCLVGWFSAEVGGQF